MPPVRPVRVLHVMGRLSLDGGVQTVVRGVLSRLDPSRVEAHVVTVRPPFEEDELDRVAASIHPLGIATRPFRTRDRRRIVAGVGRTARRLAPDVVHLHSGTAWFGAAVPVARPRAAIVLEVHDAPGSGRHGRASDALEGWWVRRGGAHALCHSASVRDDVVDRWRPPPRRVVEFPLGIDTSLFVPPTAVSPASPSGGRRTVVAVGRLVASKRFDLAIDAVARLVATGVDAELVIVGQGPTHDALADRAAEAGLGDRVRFVGARFGADLAGIVRSADALVSTSEYEGFGLTVVEAMACGVPVVAMDAGGVAELLAHGGGEVVGAGDVAAMAARLGTLLGDDELRRRTGVAGRRAAEQHYSTDVMARRFTELYERLASST